ncbi:MAG: hypothetical protein ACPGR5_04235, partial [Chitinophagales bacterium]
MKNLLFILPLTILLLTACGDSEKTSQKTTTAAVDNLKSEVYKEIISNEAGDFNGAKIGMTLKEVKALYDDENLSEEADDFLQYKLSNTYTISDYTFIFEDDKLTQIGLDTEVYDSADNNDSEQAQVLFNDLMDTFLDKFGNKYLESENGISSILFWTSEDKEIQLIKDFSEV